ncbi:MAG: 50S ribosomal protein L25 [Candidatus Omnitrophica bacterium]|nr:50S ribosomal protein L25 [Candidatus Omnitrophota bacterium]
MEEIILEVEKRQQLGKSEVRDLRQKGYIPAIIYGQGKESLPVKVSHKQFIQLVHQYHNIENMIINLRIKDEVRQKSRACLIKEIQYDPVDGDITHIDFNQISLTKEIKVNIPIKTKGQPIGVKQEGGSLEHILWEVEVECLPTDIPEHIEVDVSQLKIGEAIHIKDISFPKGVRVLNDPEAIVVSVSVPMKEELAVAEEVTTTQEPEVIKEKKQLPLEEKIEE